MLPGEWLVIAYYSNTCRTRKVLIMCSVPTWQPQEQAAKGERPAPLPLLALQQPGELWPWANELSVWFACCCICMVHMCPVLPLKGGRADFSLFPRSACCLGLLSQGGLSLLAACLFREMKGWMDTASFFLLPGFSLKQFKGRALGKVRPTPPASFGTMLKGQILVKEWPALFTRVWDGITFLLMLAGLLQVASKTSRPESHLTSVPAHTPLSPSESPWTGSQTIS